ncbi:hypothetical protein HN51_006956 [Arachis hypogaea]
MSGECPVCHQKEESTSHCLIYCSEAQEVWKKTPISCLLLLQRTMTLREWWTQMKENIAQQHHGDFELNILAITCWSVWKSRNLRVFKQTNSSPNVVVESVLKLCNELQCHPQRSSSPNS